MDEMPSSEFRRRYATLTQPTRVTVNGHAIGMWTPGPVLDEFEVAKARWQSETPQRGIVAYDPRMDAYEAQTFNSRPFRPVPK